MYHRLTSLFVTLQMQGICLLAVVTSSVTTSQVVAAEGEQSLCDPEEDAESSSHERVDRSGLLVRDR